MKKILLSLLLVLCYSGMQAQFNLNLKGHLPYPTNTCAGIWHYVDSLGNEYALVGVNDRLAIVDVTIATNPVEVFSVPALPNQSSLWREVKTAGKYAYAVSEGGGGVIIVDLSNLPAGINYKHYYGDGAILNQITSAHTIAVTDGYAYIFGTGNGLANGGAVICDLSDPWNPTYVGQYNLQYIHDGYIRNDTLWAGEIYAGQFSVIDVTNKANPVLLVNKTTPGQFCHNTWLSDNSRYLFTTDEITGEPLGSFDVSDIGNIDLIDTYYTDSMPQEEVHNVRVLNDFLINPSYGSQMVICDAARPDNIIEIANYPTGNFLCWDASPYLPSGNIIAADVDGGVYVFEPNYTRACYLEGNIIDSITTIPLNNVQVKIIGPDKVKLSNLIGDYRTGLALAGTYDVEFKKLGYKTQLFQSVSLASGQLTTLNVEMVPFVLTGTVLDATTTQVIPGADVMVTNGIDTTYTTTDGSGIFTITNMSSGNLDILVTKWGYVTFCQSIFADGSVPFSISLQHGYYDDFSTDLGWTVNSSTTSGEWERGIPVGTTLGSLPGNPGVDSQSDCSNYAFVTGNGGGNATFDDVDNGVTTLVSPVMDLTTYTDPYINYERWYQCPSTTSAANMDTLFIKISDGINTVNLEQITLADANPGTWVNASLRLSNFLTPGAAMQLSVRISDFAASQTLLECGFDKFSVTNGPQSIDENYSASSFRLFPNPGNGIFKIVLNEELRKTANLVTIMDYTGRIIYSKATNSINSETFGDESIPSGLYIVGVYSDGQLIGNQRLIKVN